MKRLLRVLRLPPLWQRDVHVVVALQYSASTTLARFTRQVRLLERIGRIVSLDAARRGDLGRLNFVVLLEGPGEQASRLADWLRRRSVPGAVLLDDHDLAAVGATSSGDMFRRAFDSLTIVNAGAPAPGQRIGQAIGREAVMAGIARTHEALAALGIAPRDYAVRWPPHVGLAVDVMEALRVRGYGCALWPAERATIVRSVHATRVLNLTWVSAPESIAGLVATLRTLLRDAVEGVLHGLPSLELSEAGTVEAGGSAARALAFENIMRESRPYASDPTFYEYLFTRNPDRGERVDYYALSTAGRVTAIGYNFHTRFTVDGEIVPGVYWASWRKLPGVGGASGFLLLKALSAEAIVGAYHPSASAREALRSRMWKRVPVSTCTMRLRDLASRAGAVGAPGHVQEFTAYPDAMDAILARATAGIRFTIARSPAWCRWRFDEYPLASVRYFVADASAPQAAYFITLRRGDIVSVADFWVPSPEAFAALMRQLAAYGQREGIATVNVETSRADLVEWMRGIGAEVAEAHNYYHFNVARSRSAAMRSLLQDWDTLTFHETHASGDVLQR